MRSSVQRCTDAWFGRLSQLQIAKKNIMHPFHINLLLELKWVLNIWIPNTLFINVAEIESCRQVQDVCDFFLYQGARAKRWIRTTGATETGCVQGRWPHHGPGTNPSPQTHTSKGMRGAWNLCLVVLQGYKCIFWRCISFNNMQNWHCTHGSV